MSTKSNKNKHLKGTIVAELSYKDLDKTGPYLAGALTAQFGGIKVTLIKVFSKDNEDDADYVLLTYDPVKDFCDEKKFVFTQAPLKGLSDLTKEFSDGPDFGPLKTNIKRRKGK